MTLKSVRCILHYHPLAPLNRWGCLLISQLQIKTKDLAFIARWETGKAPKTCTAMKELLPFWGKLLQARWGGDSAWIDIDHLPLDIEFENHTSFPSKGELIVYPGFISMKEIMISYGPTAFSSKVGRLAGNHFATIVQGLDNLEEMGRRVAWEGAQDIEFTTITT